MKINLIMKDREYLNAFSERLLRSYKNIDATISDSINSIKLYDSDEAIIHLIENTPTMFDESDLDKFSARVIVLCDKEFWDSDKKGNRHCRVGESGITYLFKYQPFSEIIKQISKKYYELTGDSLSYGGIADIICVCGDAENIHYSVITRAIAGQHKYKLGGEILHISTRSIYYSSCLDASNASNISNASNASNASNRSNVSEASNGASEANLSKIIYYLDIDKPLELESYAVCDEYGIYHLSFPYDINSLSTLDENAFTMLIEHLRTRCDVIFAEIGNEFNANSRLLLNEAKCVWWFSDKCSEEIARHSVNAYENKKIYYIDSHSDDIDMQIDEIVQSEAGEAGKA